MSSVRVDLVRSIRSVMGSSMEDGLVTKRQIFVALVFVQDSAGRFLLQKRIDPLIPEAHMRWELPGGRVEYGENPQETAARECKEETGCTIEILEILPLIQSTVWCRTDKKEQHVLISCYRARLVDGVVNSSDEKVSDVSWFSYDEALKLDLLRGTSDFLSLAIEKNK